MILAALAFALRAADLAFRGDEIDALARLNGTAFILPIAPNAVNAMAGCVLVFALPKTLVARMDNLRIATKFGYDLFGGPAQLYAVSNPVL